MPLDFVVGGQYGGEGKGLISAFLTYKKPYNILVKPGGPNSYHHYRYQDQDYEFRMLPCGSIFPEVEAIVFPPGCLIYVNQLFKEIEKYNIDEKKIKIDPQAGIISDDLIKNQMNDGFYDKAGSTLTGTGYASAGRAKRRLRLATEEKKLRNFLVHTQQFIFERMDEGILVEGGQGYGLSNYHGDYPYCSSRDTTVAGFLSQLGLGHRYIGEVYLVIKCFPTRNHMGKGELNNELSKEFLNEHKDIFLEYGIRSFGENMAKRRVGLFDFGVVERAVLANSPTKLVLTGLDKLALLLNSPSVPIEIKGPYKNFKEQIKQRLGLEITVESSGSSIHEVQFLGDKSN